MPQFVLFSSQASTTRSVMTHCLW